MENSNNIEPRIWNPRDLYQQYAEFILRNNPQAWGKYSRKAKRKNYWIYMTVGEGSHKKIVEVMNYSRWKHIMEAYFEAAKTRIIHHGEGLKMGRLGNIKARRCERDHTNPQVNFHLTRQQPRVIGEDGKERPAKTIYFTDDDYIRIAWNKYHRFTNESLYEFVPTSGDTRKDGFIEEFSRANINNPVLKYSYDYYPLTSNKMPT